MCTWVMFAEAKIANQANSSNIQDHILQSGEVETSIIFDYAVFNRPTYQFRSGSGHVLVAKDLLRQHQVCLMLNLTTFWYISCCPFQWECFSRLFQKLFWKFICGGLMLPSCLTPLLSVGVSFPKQLREIARKLSQNKRWSFVGSTIQSITMTSDAAKSCVILLSSIQIGNGHI